ncbi:MAG TPA: GntR family transcriptional regulator [Candidatus Lachnoclostridium stercoravium]|uniref:GntR family transcriptional regulator n=1 Tax=Candidatus Lachnoclostridium stercoravium TaxID=2838633 RepID=A0A9D2HIM7_9FIRM|nr:GntR family transcriptional regulator [Candidatus Lachnoclostridium stercoravium]
MIILDFRDRRPIYEQLIEKFQEVMMIGALEKDEKMPSVRQLASELSINPNTVQRAYGQLEREGYIYSVPGKGSFVADISQLKDVRREEIRRALEQTARRAFVSGISKDEFLEDAGKAYEKRREQE